MPTPPDRPFWRKTFARALDLLYPPICAICRAPLRDGRALCEACAADLPRIVPPFCAVCGEPFHGRIDGAFSCPNCSGLRFAFEFARPAAVRDDRTLAMIHRLKYQRRLHLAPELGRLASGAFEDPRFGPALAGNWPLVPVPLHRGRFQQRHFNQSAEIARTLSIEVGLPVLHALRRVRGTGHQTSLTRAERMENLRDAFSVNARGHRHIAANPAGAVLVDDVLTTGSTVHECAKTLRRAGFRRVFVVTVMRG